MQQTCPVGFSPKYIMRNVLMNFIVIGMTEEEIIAQSLVFLLGGYDNTASMMSFVMYNLASHPDIQEKVFVEVQSVCGEKVRDKKCHQYMVVLYNL